MSMRMLVTVWGDSMHDVATLETIEPMWERRLDQLGQDPEVSSLIKQINHHICRMNGFAGKRLTSLDARQKRQ